MINKENIIDAIVHLRKTNQSIPSETIDFIKKASLDAFEIWNKSDSNENTQLEKDVLFLNKKFTQKTMGEVSEMCLGSKISIEDVADFIRYRSEIKKPIKTIRPVKVFINELKKIIEAGLDKRTSIAVMKNSEWQTINLDWIAKKMPKTQSADLTQFGFKSNTQKALNE